MSDNLRQSFADEERRQREKDFERNTIRIVNNPFRCLACHSFDCSCSDGLARRTRRLDGDRVGVDEEIPAGKYRIEKK